jgi:glutathione S-transferase
MGVDCAAKTNKISEETMLTLWGRTNSLNVQKVLMCLNELRLPFVRHDAGMQFGVVKSDDYMAMNPNSNVPTLQDGDFTLWESNVIVRYLASQHAAGSLWPLEARQRAEAERWMDWQQTVHNPSLTTVFWNLVRSPGTIGEKEFAAACERTERAMDILDHRMGQAKWLGGDHFTIADCALAPGVHRYLHLPMERKARAHVQRWYDAVLQRDGAKDILLLPLS